MDNASPLPSKSNEEWTDHLASAAAIANDYSEDNWTVLLVDTQDITPLFEDPVGLAVLLQDQDYDELEELVETVSIETTHVYRNRTNDIHFLILVAEAPQSTHAIVIPAFVREEEFNTLKSVTQKTGEIHTTLRSLGTDTRVTISHDDPAIFF